MSVHLSAPGPALSIRGRAMCAFHFWGIVGLLAGGALAAVLTDPLALSVRVMLWSVAVGAAIFLALAYATKVVLGHEKLVNYHHLIAVTVAAALVARVTGAAVLPHVTTFVVALMVFQAFGRFGCFSVGCCHGRPSEWGTRYGAAHVAAGFPAHLAGVALVPVQLLEGFGSLSIATAGTTALLRGAVAADVLLTLVTAYALLRFVAEVLRGDPGRRRFGALTEAQWTSIILLAGSALAAWTTNARPRFAVAIVLLGAVLGAVGIAWAVRRRPWLGLLAPDHVLEVAGALAIVCGDSAPEATRDLHVATTSCGLSLSSGESAGGVERARHYTMSRAPAALAEREAQLMATLVMRLRHAGRHGTLMRGQRAGAFHLVVRD